MSVFEKDNRVFCAFLNGSKFFRYFDKLECMNSHLVRTIKSRSFAIEVNRTEVDVFE